MSDDNLKARLAAYDDAFLFGTGITHHATDGTVTHIPIGKYDAGDNGRGCYELCLRLKRERGDDYYLRPSNPKGGRTV